MVAEMEADFTENLTWEDRMEKPQVIKIDDVEYVRRGSNDMAATVDGLRYCIVRTFSAGVFAGYVKERSGKEGVILQARRLWKWAGAASLSQLAVDGTKDPAGCKFPCEVKEVILTEITEIIPCTEKAKVSIEGVTVWKK